MKTKKEFIFNKPLFFLKEKIDRLAIKRRTIVAFFLVVMLLLYVGINYRKIFYITLLTVVGSLSLVYIRYFKEAYVLGAELVTFSTILCGYKYGIVAGVTVGIITIFFSQVFSGRFKYSSFISILMMPLVGVAAAILNFIPITSLGIGLVIAYDLIILPLYMLLGSRAISSAIYMITHVLFAAWMFSEIAPWLVRIM